MGEFTGGEGREHDSRMAGAVAGLSKMVREVAAGLNEVRNIGLAGLQAQQAAADAGDMNAVVGFVTIEEVAGVFKVHRKTIERWIKRYGFPCFRTGGVRRFVIGDVLRWASARKEGV